MTREVRVEEARSAVSRPAGIARPVPSDPAARTAWDIAATVTDPEIPVLTIEDLGVLRSVAVDDDVVLALTHAGYDHVDVRLVLAPAWTTDWMSETGKDKLRTYGIQAPSGNAPVRDAGPVRLTLAVKCPRCDSLNTRELARFGSTSCKALYECLDCLEPFDYFKVL